MVSAISRSTSTVPGSAGPRRSPSMDAQLSTARAKLEDWVTCPSAKTPEGKAQIGKASAKLETIKAEIKKADEAIVQTGKADSPNANTRVGDAGANSATFTRKTIDDVLTDFAQRNRAAAPVFGYAPSLGGHLDARA